MPGMDEAHWHDPRRVTTHLRPTAAIAANALLPGDPKRAMDLAARIMAKPLMSNLSRGLWGYWGHTVDGHELTVQSTGIGGPSAAAVLSELHALGVTRVIRVGTCAALDPGLRPGDELVVGSALAGDGVGLALGANAAIPADAGLTAALGGTGATVASVDLMPPPGSAVTQAWAANGALALDLTTAAVFAVAADLGLAAGCALVVSAAVDGSRLDDELLDAATLALGERAARALQSASPAP